VRLFRRKSHLERLRETVNDALARPIGEKLTLLRRPSDKTRKVGWIAAGGLTGLTAGSARISSLRRRTERAEDDP
jgi:hypothetical protein